MDTLPTPGASFGAFVLRLQKPALAIAVALALGSFGDVSARPQKSVPIPAASDDDFGPNHVDVPFVSKNNWIILEVTLGKDAASTDDSPKLHFLLDTGASITAISKESFESKDLDLPTSADVDSGGKIIGIGDSGGVDVSKALDAILRVGTLEKSAKVLVFPMGKELADSGIDGVLGSDFIRKFVVDVDYQNGVVRFYNRATFKPPKTAERFSQLPLAFSGEHMPIIDASLTPFGYAATPARLELDTGDDDAVTLYSPFVKRNRWQDVLPVTVSSSSTGVGGDAASLDGRLRDIRFGGITVSHPPVSFSLSEQGAMADQNADGQLGGLIFRRYTMILDYGRKMLYLRPNKFAASPFPALQYFGFSTSDSEKRAEGCLIDDVDLASPVGLAGIRQGDILYKVDGRNVSGFSDDELTDFLHSREGVRTLEFGRDGEARRTVRVRPITY